MWCAMEKSAFHLDSDNYRPDENMMVSVITTTYRMKSRNRQELQWYCISNIRHLLPKKPENLKPAILIYITGYK